MARSPRGSVPDGSPTPTLPLPVRPSQPRGARLWVALSGGLDSTVLLHALHARSAPGLRAVHVHHGLQAAAEEWVSHLRRQCRALGVPLTVRRVQIDPRDPAGPEAAARAARYAALAALLKAGDLLATAHHREDQAETVLLRALRGTGIAGLAAMSELSPLGAGRLWRPLLSVSRAELQRYAQAAGLCWVDDPHNHDARYARSYLRDEVWPLLQRHWPQAGDSLARLAAHAQDAEGLLAELAQQDERVVGASADGALSVGALLALAPARRRNLLRHLWRGRGWAAPAAEWLQRLEAEVLRARADAQPCLRFAEGEARRYRDGLYLMAPLPPLPQASVTWRRGRSLTLPAGCGQLRLSRAPGEAFTVRFPVGGERLRPADDRHTRSLKALCQARGLPVWVRERLPLLFRGDRLVSVAGLWTVAEASEVLDSLVWDCDLPGLLSPKGSSAR